MKPSRHPSSLLDQPLFRHTISFIEVLVILFVITLLAAFYIPKTIKDKHETLRISCRGNFAQLGMGIMQYTSEMYFGDWMNAAKTPTELTRDTPQKLLEDLNLLWDGGRGLCSDSKLFRCRVYAHKSPAFAPTGIPFNSILGNPDIDYGLASQSSVTDPANKIIMADVPGGPKRKGTYGDLWSRNHNPRASSIATSDQSCLFMDSHVKLYQTANIPDDADTYPGDTGSIYCGATPTTITPGSTTDTLIFNTDDASIRP